MLPSPSPLTACIFVDRDGRVRSSLTARGARRGGAAAGKEEEEEEEEGQTSIPVIPPGAGGPIGR